MEREIYENPAQMGGVPQAQQRPATVGPGTQPRRFHPSSEKKHFPGPRPAQPGELSGAGVGEQWWADHGAQLADPGAMQQWWGQVQGMLGGPGLAEQFSPGALAQLGGPGAVQQWWGANQGQLAGPSAGQQLNAQLSPAMLADSRSAQAYDQFQGQPAGLDPYYDRARARSAGAINDQLAARGLHNSGKGVQALVDTDAALSAEQANREAQHHLATEQLRGQLAGQADSAQLGRAGMASQLAGQADQSGLARMGMGLSGAQAAGGEQLGRLQAGAGIAGMGQDAMLARLLGGAQMAGGTDSSFLDRFGAGLGGSAAAQGMQENRLQGMIENMLRQQALQQGILGNLQMGQIQGDYDMLGQSLESLMTGRSHQAGWGDSAAERSNNDVGIVGGLLSLINGGGK